MRLRTICRALALGMVLAMASLSAAAGITYQIFDPVDAADAPNIMRIDYRIDTPTPIFYGYTLRFNPDQFADLQTASDAEWFASVIQPDPSFSLSGTVDLLALANAPAGARFSVEFTWLGSGTPGAQSYDMFDDAFTIIDSGLTQVALPTPQPVPEPLSTSLMLAGLVALMRQRYRR